MKSSKTYRRVFAHLIERVANMMLENNAKNYTHILEFKNARGHYYKIVYITGKDPFSTTVIPLVQLRCPNCEHVGNAVRADSILCSEYFRAALDLDLDTFNTAINELNRVIHEYAPDPAVS